MRVFRNYLLYENMLAYGIRQCLCRLPFYDSIRNFVEDENGVGVIEVVLILVVLIGLVAVFKTQINELLTKIFGSISSMSDDIL